MLATKNKQSIFSFSSRKKLGKIKNSIIDSIMERFNGEFLISCLDEFYLW